MSFSVLARHSRLAAVFFWVTLSRPCLLGAQDPSSAAVASKVMYYDVAELLETAEAGRPFPLSLDDSSCWVTVQRNYIRSDRYRARATDRNGRRAFLPPMAKIFKGKIAGEPDSTVRLSFGRRGLSGFVKRGDQTTYIEPLEDDSNDGHAKTQTAIPHRAISDLGLEIVFDGTCGTDAPARSNVQPTSPEPSSKALSAEGSFIEMEIAVEADYEFFQIHGANSAAKIEEFLNVVDGIFESQLELTLAITSVEIFEADVDPYTTNDALGLLEQFRAHWNSQKGSVPRDVAHLFTGRELENNTVGIAYVEQVCKLGAAYGISQSLTSETMMPLLVSHELGHNLGAFHDARNSRLKFVMNPVLHSSTLDEFSDQSKSEIATYVNGMICLDIVLPEDSSDPGDVPPNGGTSPPTGGGAPAADGGGPVDPIVLLVGLWAVFHGLQRRLVR